MRAGDRTLPLGERTYVMAIVNLTDDSFSGDGVGRDMDQAVRRAVDAERQGADIIDIGGESARADVPVRDAEEEEFALVRNPAELDPRSRAALETALAVAGFVFEVTRVLEIEEEVEIRRWQVETRQGPRTFQTRLDDWPRTLPHGGLLIRDLAGDLYHLAAPEQLDRQSRELLWAFVD